jgi:hypothetical protein
MRGTDLNEFVKSAEKIQISPGLCVSHCGSDSIVGKLGGTAAKVNAYRNSFYEVPQLGQEVLRE